MLLKKLGLKIPRYLSAQVLCLFASTPVLALTASTSRTIQGTSPVLSIDGGKTAISDLNELLYVALPNGTKITPDISTTIAVPSVSFDKLGSLLGMNSTAKPIPLNYYYDKELDLARLISPIVGNYSAVLKNVDGVVITDMTTKFEPCNGSPYTLTMSMSQSSVFSEYGDPISTVYPSRSVTYTLVAADPVVCYLKTPNIGEGELADWYVPVSDRWNDGTGERDPRQGGGYTKDFVPNKGFVASSTATGAKFPTTGFKGATFEMMMSGGQDQFTYSIEANPTNSVDIDPLTGVITLISKPSGSVTLRAKSIHDYVSPVSYTFNLNLWAVPLQGQTGLSEAQDKFAALGYPLLSITELTNSPAKGIVTSLPWEKRNGFTRAIDGSIGSEWGYIGYYDKSEWKILSENIQNEAKYWTRDVVDGQTNQQYGVIAFKGQIEATTIVTEGIYPAYPQYAACRG